MATPTNPNAKGPVGAKGAKAPDAPKGNERKIKVDSKEMRLTLSNLTADQIQELYSLEVLKEFAREFNIQTSGSEYDIAKRIKTFLGNDSVTSLEIKKLTQKALLDGPQVTITYPRMPGMPAFFEKSIQGVEVTVPTGKKVTIPKPIADMIQKELDVRQKAEQLSIDANGEGQLDEVLYE